MEVRLIQVPYDSGHKDLRMGKGPAYLIQNGLLENLKKLDFKPQVISIDSTQKLTTEISTTFELCQHTATAVKQAQTQDAFPLVLSGNCIIALGTIAGLDPSPVGIIWLDGHSDFRTPDVSPNGFLDSMGLSTAVGMCWKMVANRIPNFHPVPPTQVLHIGARQLHPKERELLDEAGVSLVESQTIECKGVPSALRSEMERLRSEVHRVYVHLDVDVLDPDQTPSNEFALPDGLTVQQLKDTIRLINEHFQVEAIGVASYDPSLDTGTHTLQTINNLIPEILKARAM